MAEQARPREAGQLGVGGSDAPAKRWRYSRWGSVFLSVDFCVGLPLGAAFGAFVAYSGAAANAVPAILITFAAADIALLALALAAITLISAVASPEYLVLLSRTSGGMRAVSRPFKIVASIGAFGALASLALAVAWPAIPLGPEWWWRALRWSTFGVASFATFWALIGSVQLVELGTFHMEKRASLVEIVREARRRGREGRTAGGNGQ